MALLYTYDKQKDATRRWHESVNLFDCNLTKRKQVSELAAKLAKQFGTIELVIHQECCNQHSDDFVSQTSNDILGFVNVSLFFELNPINEKNMNPSYSFSASHMFRPLYATTRERKDCFNQTHPQ